MRVKVMKPILFNTEMVQAILDRRKTVTRRCIKHEIHMFEKHGEMLVYDNRYLFDFALDAYIDSQAKYKKGDVLYVRETWSTHYTAESNGELVYCYKADGLDLKAECLPGENNRWYPSIHMPKEAARLFLRITDVRIERLQDITEEQAMQEGVEKMSTPNIPGVGETFIQGFGELWNSTIKKSELDKYGWHANPYVFVYRFNVISKAEAMKESEI